MQLSDLAMAVALLALVMYVVLDGYDLGIGVLTLLERDPGRKRAMYELVARAWDGNESWLVLVGLMLWAGTPDAFGAALPALYLVLFPMLWSLIARGVSIELIAQSDGWHRVWGRVFGVGSLLAAFCQGAAFGGLVAGVAVRGADFAGGPFSFVHHGYAALSGATAVALYVVAAASWVHVNSDGALRDHVARRARPALALVLIGAAACWALLPSAGSTTLHPGDGARLPVWIAGAVVLVGGLAVTAWAFATPPRTRSDRRPVWGTLAIYAGGLAVALGLLYPRIVPPSISVHAAAAPHSSLLFLLIGVGIFVPIILTYQTYGYWVFRPQQQGARPLESS